MCHILVIEDEPLIADYVCELATDAGATSIDTAATEAEALRAAFGRRPALILSDVRLVRGSGPVACAAIRDALGDIPVIFITGTPQDCSHCHYAAAVLTKPIVPEHVIAAIRQVAPLP